MSLPPLIVLAGPTASGKSRLAIQLAEKIGGEIISADSRLIYRGLDIGTAKPSPEERRQVPHHLLDIVEPDEFFSAYDYQVRARALINEIVSRGKIPLLVGGTGLYIRAVLEGFDFPTEASPELKGELEEKAAELGPQALHEELQKVDPEASEKIHPNDLFRTMRALEVYYATGNPVSLQRKREQKPLYNYVYLCLTDDRQRLYDRIDRRVLQMMKGGLLEEVKGVAERYGMGRPEERIGGSGKGGNGDGESDTPKPETRNQKLSNHSSLEGRPETGDRRPEEGCGKTESRGNRDSSIVNRQSSMATDSPSPIPHSALSHVPVLKTIGYRELIEYMEGKYPPERAVELIQQHSRNYAKRQLIWFRRVQKAVWLDWQEFPTDKEMIDKIVEILFNKTIVNGLKG